MPSSGVSRHNYYSAVRNEQLEPDPQHDELIEWVQKIAMPVTIPMFISWKATRALMKEADVSVRRRENTSNDQQQPSATCIR